MNDETSPTGTTPALPADELRELRRELERLRPGVRVLSVLHSAGLAAVGIVLLVAVGLAGPGSVFGPGAAVAGGVAALLGGAGLVRSVAARRAGPTASGPGPSGPRDRPPPAAAEEEVPSLLDLRLELRELNVPLFLRRATPLLAAGAVFAGAFFLVRAASVVLAGDPGAALTDLVAAVLSGVAGGGLVWSEALTGRVERVAARLDALEKAEPGPGGIAGRLRRLEVEEEIVALESGSRSRTMVTVALAAWIVVMALLVVVGSTTPAAAVVQSILMAGLAALYLGWERRVREGRLEEARAKLDPARPPDGGRGGGRRRLEDGPAPE